MKISKESHRKTGVGVNPETGTVGLLYRDPLDREEKIQAVVEKRADSTKRLYNLFGSGDVVEGISEGAKNVAQISNKAIGNLKEYHNKFKNIHNPERITDQLDVEQIRQALLFAKRGAINSQKKKAEKYNKEFKGLFIHENDVDEALNRLLKKNFRLPASKSAIKILLMSTLVKSRELSVDEVSDIQKNFVLKLVADYNKTSIKANIPKALMNQNMVIQPSADGTGLVIAETKNSNANKTSEKDAFRQFLSDYAVLDNGARHELRVKLRRLVDLYFYGESGVRKDDFNEWILDKEKRKSTDLFVNKITREKKSKDGKLINVLDADATADAIRKKNIECYRAAIAYVTNNELFFADEKLNKFWIHHIESEVERLYKNLKSRTVDYKLQLSTLSENVWKGIINFLSIKYIAQGKAVYNYAMTALSKDNDCKEFGKLDERFINGISSFEYERIKAEETLQRDCAVNVAFAANHLANATVVLDDKNTDFLLLKNTESNKSLANCASKKPNTLRNILQFFGGQSDWKDFDFSDCDEIELLDDFKEMIYSLRNSSFHFKTENIADKVKNKELINSMFEYDCIKAGTVQKNKMYSNNVPMFYNVDDIEGMLKVLYSKINERTSQVPSFNTVFVRRNFPEYLNEQGVTSVFNADETLKLHNAIYYLYKEIYYNGFIQDKAAYDLLKEYVKKLDERCENKQLAGANRDFKNAFRMYSQKADTLSAICQMIMAEYNNQNNNRDNDNQIFKHYRVNLLAGLRYAFTEYVKAHSNVYGFISSPAIETMPALEDFIPAYKTNQYRDLISVVKENPELQKWYVTGRLLNKKQVNRLIGSFRNYKQYVSDVVRRASQIGNPLSKSEVSVDVDKIISVLDICIKLNGIISNALEDYFDNKDDYAKYISRFVDVDNDNAIGIYYDGKNPILNRNVILCKLYGATEVISKAGIGKVNCERINNYKNTAESIKDYQITGVCKTVEDQVALRKYQELKNMVELRSIVEYSEIINELQGQLINWCYLRERDLMYFQLGFHYLCLKNSSIKPDGYDKAGDMLGTILYQIVAMYTNGLPTVDASGNSKKNATASVPSKIMSFCRDTKNITGNEEYFYFAGLELFENIKEHEKSIDLRNYVEHFHYYAKQDKSILEIYSEVFDSFFTHDMKFAKSVPNMLCNILLQHLIVAKLDIGGDKKERGTTISLSTKNGLVSEMFTYKIGEEKKPIKVEARSEDYVKDVAAILCYKI